MKTCIGCGLEKSATEFNKQASSPDGLRPRCKECRKTETQSWYAAHQETIQKRSAKWRKDNRERYAEQMRNWRKKNRDRKRTMDRKWYAANRDYAMARATEYQKAHPEKAKNQRARRRAQMGATVHRITKTEWAALKDRYEGCCAYCGNEEPNPTMDHVIPLIKGGHHTVDNIVPACGSCNRAKGTMTVMEFLALRRKEQ